MKHHLVRLVLAVAAVLAGVYSLSAGGPQEDSVEGKQEKPPEKTVETPRVVTMQGKVIDMACFLANDGALGGDHQTCAEACVKGGATTAFQTADRSYVVLRDPLHQKDAPDLSKHVNRDAEITAQLLSRDGLQALKVLTIK